MTIPYYFPFPSNKAGGKFGYSPNITFFIKGVRWAEQKFKRTTTLGTIVGYYDKRTWIPNLDTRYQQNWHVRCILCPYQSNAMGKC